MNKKFLAVIGSATVAAAFWACGSGDIYEATENDLIFQEMSAKSGGKNLCPDGCDGAFYVESSSSSSEEENPFGDISSSSLGNDDQPIVIVKSSSSEGLIIDTSAIGQSSASTPVSGLGTCAPLTNPVDKNTATAQYKFTPNATSSGYKVVDFAAATYEWDFGANGSAASNAKSTSDMVTYTASGEVVASVVVTMKDGASEKITCSPLQVNGDPITNCSCTTDADGTVDFTATPDVTWKVAGCKSSSDITSYSWNGVAGTDPTFTKTFAAAQAGWAPTLKVGNSDKTIISVTCPAVKTSEGPEYQLGFEGDQIPSSTKAFVEMPFNLEACINVNFKWTNSGYQPSNISVLCDVTAAQNSPGLTMDVKYGTSSKSYKGDYNISNSGIALGAITSGVNDKGNVCVTIKGTAGGSAKCFFGN